MPDHSAPPRSLLLVGAVFACVVAAVVGVLVAPRPLPFTTDVLQRETSPEIYEPFGDAGDPEPVEVLLVRRYSLGGAVYTFQLGHDAENYFHEVTVPDATGAAGPPEIASVDWTPDEITVRLASGHAVVVPAEKAVGHR
ncbi:hypothetical protein O4J56_31705 [Nocardiopsis sp. RSe5-2]|uniref:Uncharacterized protein n=1 Tax=Nocardiopsis endophytica TaxID=3018445 RepID=A0ABT4UE69_9ACTN|nr:hypothetical protein [Nocardiopsis endophytica]MDA2815251.1 hypothetical protein [Nocardiopsis endophytica]